MAKKKGGGGANWMDTYGDMVTLLLCFFVLLYSMSTISTDKFKAIVMSFNPNAIFDQTEIVGGNDGPSADAQPSAPAEDPSISMAEQQAAIEKALLDLYEALKDYVEQSESAPQIELSRGDGYVFISFSDAVFFQPDRYVMLPEGEKVIADVAAILDTTAEYIDEIRVMGHTAHANINVPNNVYGDRLLSAERGGVVCAYIQMNAPNIEPARLVSEGYGMHRSIAPNDTEAGKKKNRRVEILVSGKDLLDEMGDSLEQYNNIVGVGGTTAGQADQAGQAEQ